MTNGKDWLYKDLSPQMGGIEAVSKKSAACAIKQIQVRYYNKC